MSIKIMDLVFDGGPNDTVGRFILLAIADHADDEGSAYPGIALLAQKTDQTERNVQRVLTRLELEGWIAVQHRGALVETADGRRRMNRYYLNIERLRGRAQWVREERARKKGQRSSSPDTASYTPQFRPTESMVCGDIPDAKSDEEFTNSTDAQASEEGRETLCKTLCKTCETPAKEGTLKERRPDNSATLTGQLSPLHTTFPTPSHDIPGSLYKKNLLEPSLKPEAGTEDEPKYAPTPFRGEFTKASETAQQIWSRLLASLKRDLGSQPLHPNFTSIRRGCPDWEACFAWTRLTGWCEQPGAKVIFALGLPDVSVAPGPDVAATRLGLAKYAKRLERLVREYYPVPQAWKIEFEVTADAAA